MHSSVETCAACDPSTERGPGIIADDMNLRVVTLLLLVRTVAPSVYRRLIGGEATEQEVIDALFVGPGSRTLRESDAGTRVLGELISCVLLSNRAADNGVDRGQLPVLSEYLALRPAARHRQLESRVCGAVAPQ